MAFINRHKGLLIGLLVVAIAVILLDHPSTLSQHNERLIQTMKVFQVIRLLVVLGIVLCCWNRVSRALETFLSIAKHRLSRTRNRVLIWYLVIEAVFALGMYT